jgi:hypothetical protein
MIDCGGASRSMRTEMKPTTNALLTVTAYVKWGEIIKPSDSYYGDPSVRALKFLYNYGVADEERDAIADFWPDDPCMAFNDTGRLGVLCVLCAVAGAQLDDIMQGDTMLTGIAVIQTCRTSQVSLQA